MDHPIKQLIDRFFPDKGEEKRNKWAQYLIDQEFQTIEDLREVPEQTWTVMSPDIPLNISLTIRKKINQSQKVDIVQPVKKVEESSVKKLEPFQYKVEQMPQMIEKAPQKSGLGPSFQALANIIGNDSQFTKVRVQIDAMGQLEDVVRALQVYMGSKQANQLAIGILKQLNKDNKVINPIDVFETKLRKSNLNSKVIGQIRYLIDRGKKLAVRNRLLEELGLNNGQTMFKELLNFLIEKPSKPIEGSKYIKEKNGLKLYQYSENLSELQKSSAKTLIVFGETGCGKSTFLNAIVNYIAGVEMEDTFRYIVVIENDNNQLKSITNSINDYYVKNSRTGQLYRLIDTPGFGDTEGIQKDKQLVKMISVKFKKDIECIHSVLFVMKASTNRVTPYQRYVFQSVMDLFDKEIAPNFVFIFTFSDSGKPQVLPSVIDRQYGFGNYWNQIIEPKYIEVNNCGFFEKIDEKDRIKTHYWKIGIECLDKLFGKINIIHPKSLTQSKEMIRTKETLNNQIINTTAIIQQAISKRQNIKKHIQAIVYHKDQINNNKNFTYQFPQDQWYADTTSSNVTRCNTAQCFAEKNCHINCRFGDGQSKKDCIAMNSAGKCKICGCSYVAHTNSNIVRKVRQIMKTKINSENKRKYDLSNAQMKTSEAALKDLFNQLEVEMRKVIDATHQMKILQDQLVNVQMSDRKPQSTRAYLQYLIQNENRQRSPNYQRRIEGYHEAIKEIQLHQKIMQGKGSTDVKKLMNEIKEANAQNIIDQVEPGFFQKIKNLIF